MSWGNLQTIITSGVVAAITTSLLTHLSNKRLDIQQRTMGERKRIYTEVINQFTFFTSNRSKEESDDAVDDLLRCFREIQVWGSDEVVRSFSNLLNLMKDEDSAEDERNMRYKELVVEMRRNILGKTSLDPKEVDIKVHSGDQQRL